MTVTGPLLKARWTRAKSLINIYSWYTVGKALACHLNVKGSIPTPAMIFHAFYGTNALPPPSRGSESEREKIILWWRNIFHFQILYYESKSIKTRLSKNKNKSSDHVFFFFFNTKSHRWCWYKDNRQRVRKNKPSVYITVYQQNPRPFVMPWM